MRTASLILDPAFVVAPVHRRTFLELAWHSTEPNTVGVDEFLRWCRKAEVEPMMAVNLDATGAQVDGHHRFALGLAAPPEELVDADGVRLGAVPGQLEAGRALLDRPDAVLPPVPGHEVPAGVAHRADAQLTGQVDDVAAEAVVVRRGVTGVVDPGVHAPTQVLNEGPEGTPVNRGDCEDRVDGQCGGAHGLSLGRVRWAVAPRETA